MTFIKPIRIEPAFDDHEQIRAMFERHAPYRALAAYAPEGIQETHPGTARRVESPPERTLRAGFKKRTREPRGGLIRGSVETGPWRESLSSKALT